MKFSLFLHMERSDPAVSQRTLFGQLEMLVIRAEEAGFETAWIGEHHAMEFTIAPNPFIQLSHLAARTKRIRLGTGSIIAPFWHPIKLAGEAAMTDIACEGRLDLGIARGAYAFEYERLVPGLDAMTAGLRMRELIPAVQKLWEGDYEHCGEGWRFPRTTSAPKPIQAPVPIWVAARDPNSHDFAVASGCNVQITPLASGDEEVWRLIERFETAVAAHPEVARPRLMLLQHAFVAQNAAETTQFCEDLSAFYCDFGAWFANKRPVVQGFMRPMTEPERAAQPNFAPESLGRNLVIGEAPAMIERLKAYEARGVDQFAIWMDSGIAYDRKRKSLELFIRDVMPAFH